MDKEEIKQFILQLSAEAGEFLRNNFYTNKNVVQKDIGSLLTNIDLDLEEILRKRIKEVFPDDEVVIYESDSNSKLPDSERVWIIDPLDGSSHFSRNIPIYTVNIAFQYKGETIFGTVNNPSAHELFFAQKDAGAFLNGISINVSEISKLSDAYVFAELPEKKFSSQPQGGAVDFDKSMQIFSNLVKESAQVETFRIGALGECLVASGSFDVYIDLSGSSQILSHAASHLILRESGCNIVNISEPGEGFIQIMASNPELTSQLEKLVN